MHHRGRGPISAGKAYNIRYAYTSMESLIDNQIDHVIPEGNSGVDEVTIPR